MPTTDDLAITLCPDLEKLIERKDFVCSHVPHCPKCGEQMQIQVKDYIRVPAHWRCRICKHHFDYEPSNEE